MKLYQFAMGGWIEGNILKEGNLLLCNVLCLSLCILVKRINSLFPYYTNIYGDENFVINIFNQ